MSGKTEQNLRLSKVCGLIGPSLSNPADPTANTRSAEMAELLAASGEVGAWLSAALEDPSVCPEMKADINRWFATLDAVNSGSNRREDQSETVKNDQTSCEICGAALVQTGAPIWENYCPVLDCDRELRRMRASRLAGSRFDQAQGRGR